MKNTDKILSRLKRLYYAIMIGIAMAFTGMVVAIVVDFDSFKEGFEMGFKAEAQYKTLMSDTFKARHESGRSNQKAYVDQNESIFLYDVGIYSDMPEIEVVVSSDSLLVTREVSTVDIRVQTASHMERPPVWKFVSVLLRIFIYPTWLLIAITIISLMVVMGKSIKHKDLFNIKLVRRYRRLALLILIYSVLSEIVEFGDRMVVSQLVENSQWEMAIPLPIPFIAITWAAVLYIVGEVLNLGLIIKEEQELTI